MTISEKTKFLIIMLVMGLVFRMGYRTGYERAVQVITEHQIEEINRGLQDLDRQLDAREPRNMGASPFRERPIIIRYPEIGEPSSPAIY